jgi:glyoxylase-like metal-dependent hydrolase (beta-lactamase superfamily II)
MSTFTAMRPLELGSTTVQQVVELDRWSHPAFALFPALTEAQFEEARLTCDERSVDPANGDFLLCVHSWVIRTKHHVILVDSCNGNHKERPAFQSVHQLDTPYLARLAEAGVTPEEVDYVICTHLHPDHTGWNTRLVDGQWVPTFPNAKYIFGRLEYDDMKAWYDKGKRSHPLDADLARSFQDSVEPIVEAGLALFVEQEHVVEHELGQGVHLQSTPGHTRGHSAIVIEGGGKRAIATGDAVHHLIQLNHPDLPQGADIDPEASTATRRRLFEELADTDTIMLPGHFPLPTAGRIVSRGDRLEYAFLDR